MPRSQTKAVRASSFPLIILVVVLAGSAPVEAASLRAGAAACNITKDQPSPAVHDPLRARALFLDDGKTQVLLVSVDLIQASGGLVASLRGRVEKELNVDGKHVLVCASHNHHTQGQVAGDLVERIVTAARQAADRMVAVKIGAGTGQEAGITMNRRLRLEDGKVWTIRRANPSPHDDRVAAVGPIDPEIGILRLDRLDGHPMAVLFNFAGHAYGGVPGGGVTADFPGFAAAVLEDALGHGAVALFVQGASGDVTPVRYKDVDAPPPTEQLGTMLGLSTLRAAREIATEEGGTIELLSETLELPRRRDLPERIESLEAQQEEILQFFTGVGCGTHGAGTSLNFKTFLPLYLKHLADPDHPAYASYLYKQEELFGRDDLVHLDAENKQRLEKYLQCIDHMERLIRVRSNLQALKRRLEKGPTGPITAEVSVLRIGDFLLVTFPGEAFAEIGLDIKRQSPFEHTFLAGYCNGSVGYAPTADAYDDEAYEDVLAQLAPEWQAIYEAKVLDMLRRLHEKPD